MDEGAYSPYLMKIHMQTKYQNMMSWHLMMFYVFKIFFARRYMEQVTTT